MMWQCSHWNTGVEAVLNVEFCAELGLRTVQNTDLVCITPIYTRWLAAGVAAAPSDWP
jgi:hypothetical protein